LLSYSSTSSALIIRTCLHRLPHQKEFYELFKPRKYQKEAFCSALIHCLWQGICNIAAYSGHIAVVLGPGIRQRQATCRNGRIIQITSRLLKRFLTILAPLLKPHQPRESTMAPTTPMPSALTFELIARCSVIPTIHLTSHKLTESRPPKLVQQSLPFPMDQSNYHFSCQSQRKPHSKD
jgi:hypothetical protein